MGLLDKAIDETKKYIRVNFFLFHVAYTQNENMDNVISWLLNNDFPQNILSYTIDDNFRIIPNETDINTGVDISTFEYLEMIQPFGLYDYLSYLHAYHDNDFETLKTYNDFDYLPINIDFYYRISDLEQIEYIKNLNITFQEISKNAYTLFSNDKVDCKKNSIPNTEYYYSLKVLPPQPNPFDPVEEKQQYFLYETLTNTDNLNNNQQPIDQTAQLQAEIDRLTAENQQQAETIRQLNERLEGQASQPTAEPIGETIKGIAKVNHDKATAQRFASIVAEFLWDMDTEKRIRTGRMANQIYSLLYKFDSNATPQTADTIKEWIKPNAPIMQKKAVMSQKTNRQLS